jgi:hypothetical protein
MADGTSLPSPVDVSDYSDLQRARLAYAAPAPAALAPGAAPALVASEPTTGRSSSDAAALRSWFPHTAGLPIVAVVPGAARAAGAVPLTGAPLRVGVVFAGRREPARSLARCARARARASALRTRAPLHQRLAPLWLLPAGCFVAACRRRALAGLASYLPPHPPSHSMLVARPQSLLAATTSCAACTTSSRPPARSAAAARCWVL